MRYLVFILIIFSVNSYAGIIRQDVRHFSVSGQTGLIGDVTLSAGGGVTLTQIGQNITITASSTILSSVSTKTTNYTVTTSDQVILANAATGGFVLTLPSASSSSGSLWNFQKIDSTNSTVSIITTGSDLIKNGYPLSGEKILVISEPGVEVNIISNGSSFYAF